MGYKLTSAAILLLLSCTACFCSRAKGSEGAKPSDPMAAVGDTPSVLRAASLAQRAGYNNACPKDACGGECCDQTCAGRVSMAHTTCMEPAIAR